MYRLWLRSGLHRRRYDLPFCPRSPSAHDPQSVGDPTKEQALRQTREVRIRSHSSRIPRTGDLPGEDLHGPSETPRRPRLAYTQEPSTTPLLHRLPQLLSPLCPGVRCYRSPPQRPHSEGCLVEVEGRTAEAIRNPEVDHNFGPSPLLSRSQQTQDGRDRCLQIRLWSSPLPT